MTLHLYSSVAYNNVRKHFNNRLPHPKVISKWYKKVNGRPGFMEASFQMLKDKVERKKERNIFI